MIPLLIYLFINEFIRFNYSYNKNILKTFRNNYVTWSDVFLDSCFPEGKIQLRVCAAQNSSNVFSSKNKYIETWTGLTQEKETGSLHCVRAFISKDRISPHLPLYYLPLSLLRCPILPSGSQDCFSGYKCEPINFHDLEAH